MSKMRVALIPSYEPDERLITLVDRLKDNDFIVVVVNDGSSEEYDRIFSRLNKKAVVLEHEYNRGKGAALRTGLSYIKTCFGKRCVVVTLDSDGQHTVSDAIKVFEAGVLFDGELILGSRSFEGDVPLRSKFGNTITGFIYRVLTGVNVKDTQTGLRAFSGDMIDEFLTVAGDRYEYEMNVLLTCASRGIQMREISIATIYENNNEVSHFNAVGDSLRIYKEIIKFSASSFLSFLIDYFMYLVVLQVTGWMGLAYGLLIANITARLISGTFNFTVNRKAVFDNNGGLLASAVRYTVLALSILLFNTSCLYFLVNLLGVNAYVAKVVVECVMFIISFLAQKKIVFKERREAFA